MALRAVTPLIPMMSAGELMEPHPALGLWFKRNFSASLKGSCYESRIAFDRFGSRSMSAKPLGAYGEAWLFVGDSMVQGLQVDNEALFTTILQSKVGDAAIINLGKSGSGPAYYNRVIYNFVDKEKVHAHVTRVYYFVTMENDFQNLFEEIPDNALNQFLRQHFYDLKTYQLLKSAFIQLRTRHVVPKEVFAHQKNEQGLPFYAYPNERSDQAFARLDSLWTELEEFSTSHKLQIVIVPIPAIEQLEAGVGHSVYQYPIESLITLSKRHGFQFCDLAKDMIIFKEKNKVIPPYFSLPCDSHLSPFGHRVVAELLFEHLRSSSGISAGGQSPVELRRVG